MLSITVTIKMHGTKNIKYYCEVTLFVTVFICVQV